MGKNSPSINNQETLVGSLARYQVPFFVILTSTANLQAIWPPDDSVLYPNGMLVKIAVDVQAQVPWKDSNPKKIGMCSYSH